MTPAWTAPELTALGRLPMDSPNHADRLSLDGRWRTSRSLPEMARAH